MVFTKAQAIVVFKQAGVAYANEDAVEALCDAMKDIEDEEIAHKHVKAAFYIAAQAGRKSVTRQDIAKIASDMQSKPVKRGRLR